MKKALVLLFYIILIALFVSCNPEVLDISGQESLKDEHGIGNLMVSTEGNSSERTIQPESIERSCSSYQIFVKSTTGDYNEVFSTDQKALLIEGLDVDSYEVYVEGVNDLGINIEIGRAHV